jgi:transposase InsO family protein
MIKRMVKAESNISIEKLCNLLELAVSSYYYQPVRQAEQEQINQMAEKMFEDSFDTYGKRRLSNALIKEGFAMGVYKTSRLMKTLGLVAKRPKKPHYYPVGKALPNIPNHLNREFNPPHINTHWVGDMTYIRSHQGWSYLATVMDLGNREIVGYEISTTPDAHLAKRALINAIAKHQPDTSELLFHSDQGVQYTANLFKACLALHKIKLHLLETEQKGYLC